MMASRLQMRLNPVPESLNSPDIPPPSSNSLSRPPRDDPLRVYNRDYLPKQIISQKSEPSKKKEYFSSSSEENAQPLKPKEVPKNTSSVQRKTFNKKNVQSKINTGLVKTENGGQVKKQRPASASTAAAAAQSIYSRSSSLTSRRSSVPNKQVGFHTFFPQNRAQNILFYR